VHDPVFKYSGYGIWKGDLQIKLLMHDYPGARHVFAIDWGYDLYRYTGFVVSLQRRRWQPMYLGLRGMTSIYDVINCLYVFDIRHRTHLERERGAESIFRQNFTRGIFFSVFTY
jgi:hypothetical protein